MENPGGDRETFLAAWSVALFEQRTLTDENKDAYNVEGRTFEFLDKILTPFDPAQNTHVFFTDDGLNWETGEGQYSLITEDLVITGGGGLRTFAASELGTNYQRCYFRNHPELWLQIFENELYVMTRDQFNYAHDIANGRQVLPSDDPKCQE